jgi:hypothetical protein
MKCALGLADLVGIEALRRTRSFSGLKLLLAWLDGLQRRLRVRPQERGAHSRGCRRPDQLGGDEAQSCREKFAVD